MLRWTCSVDGCDRGVPYTDHKLCERHAREHHPTCCYANAGDLCFCHVQPLDAARGSRNETKEKGPTT